MRQLVFQCQTCHLSVYASVERPLVAYRACPKCGAIAERRAPVANGMPGLGMSATKLRPPPLPSGSTDLSGEGTKYLYLQQMAFAETWVNGGGPIPLNPASAYLSDSRVGVMTPDETLVHDSAVDLTSLRPAVHVENVKGFSFIGCSINGWRVPDIVDASFYREDGLVLCFSNVLSAEICRRLGKVACVAVDDMLALKRHIDGQLGVESIGGSCEYTSDHRRNHFLKHCDDEWMKEFRLLWPRLSQGHFYLPPGMARHCNLE